MKREWMPIQIDQRSHIECPVRVPFLLFRRCEQRCHENHSQDLETIAARGGFDPAEAVYVLEDIHWHSALNGGKRLEYGEAVKRLKRLVAAFNEGFWYGTGRIIQAIEEVEAEAKARREE